MGWATPGALGRQPSRSGTAARHCPKSDGLRPKPAVFVGPSVQRSHCCMPFCRLEPACDGGEADSLGGHLRPPARSPLQNRGAASSKRVVVILSAEERKPLAAVSTDS